MSAAVESHGLDGSKIIESAEGPPLAPSDLAMITNHPWVRQWVAAVPAMFAQDIAGPHRRPPRRRAGFTFDVADITSPVMVLHGARDVICDPVCVRGRHLPQGPGPRPGCFPAVVVATGATPTGDREVLGVEVGDREDGACWAAFLKGPRARGLTGGQLVISDHHLGLKEAIPSGFIGAAWLRCRVHFMWNLLARMPKGAAEMVAAAMRTIVPFCAAASLSHTLVGTGAVRSPAERFR